LQISQGALELAGDLPTVQGDKIEGWCHLSLARKFQGALLVHLFAEFAQASQINLIIFSHYI